MKSGEHYWGSNVYKVVVFIEVHQTPICLVYANCGAFTYHLWTGISNFSNEMFSYAVSHKSRQLGM